MNAETIAKIEAVSTTLQADALEEEQAMARLVEKVGMLSFSPPPGTLKIEYVISPHRNQSKLIDAELIEVKISRGKLFLLAIGKYNTRVEVKWIDAREKLGGLAGVLTLILEREGGRLESMRVGRAVALSKIEAHIRADSS